MANRSKISISELVRGKSTYPSWSTNATYPLLALPNVTHTEVSYIIKGGRKIHRPFPKTLHLTPQFSYALGLLKGEGANSLGKSNYRRFTITNSDPKVIKFLLDQLNNQQLFLTSTLKKGSIHLLHHTKRNSEAVHYWSHALNLPQSVFKCFEDKTKTSPYGVCHIYLSDVLLRRIVDILHDKLMNLSPLKQ